MVEAFDGGSTKSDDHMKQSAAAALGSDKDLGSK